MFPLLKHRLLLLVVPLLFALSAGPAFSIETVYTKFVYTKAGYVPPPPIHYIKVLVVTPRLGEIILNTYLVPIDPCYGPWRYHLSSQIVYLPNARVFPYGLRYRALACP